MVIMGKGRAYEPETCSGAIRSALARSAGKATAEELFNQVKRAGHWTDDNIWQEMLSHTVNLPPSYHHYAIVTLAQRFLFLREDGNFEMFDPNWHGRYLMGKRIV
jgi:hypothetical protein